MSQSAHLFDPWIPTPPELVDPSLWNRTERKNGPNYIHPPATATAVEDARCDGGYMVTVRDGRGREHRLSVDWLLPVKRP